MELLDSINIPFTQDTTGVDLYYGCYKYRIKARVVGIERTRYAPTVEKFDKLIKGITYPMYGGSGSISSIIIRNGGNLEKLRRFIEWRTNTATADRKVVLTRNHINLYFNDPGSICNFVDLLEQDDHVSGFYRTRIGQPSSSVIYRVKSKYEHRMYLTTQVFQPSDVLRMQELVDQYPIKPCRSLARSLETYGRHSTLKPAFYVYDGNFLDYNGDWLSTIILLNWPTIAKRICRIEKR